MRLGDLSDATLPLSSPNAGASSETYPLYSISPVITVAAPEPEPTPTPTPTPQPPANNEPEFASDDADRSVNENSPAGTSVGDPVTASDDDGDTLTYDLTGSDAFAINAAGQITVASSATLNYEDTPSYTVSVTVHDGVDAEGEADDTVDDTIAVNVSVTNVDEAGAASLAWDGDSPQAESAVTASLTDPDGSVTGLAWAWERSPDGSSDWNAIAGATSATYTPANEDAGFYLRAVASYADGHGPGKSAASAGAGPVVGVIQPPADPEPQKAPNRQPQFDGETADRSVNENSPAGTSVGDPVTASDDDGDTLTYDLTGSDAFTIDDSGQITVAAGASLDYEDTPSHTLSVTVHDGVDAEGEADDTVDDTITVNVSVTNVDEAGAASLAWEGDSPQADSAVTASLTDPDGSVTGLAWTWERSSDGSSDWNAIAGATSATYTPTNEDTGFYLRAVASYADGHGPGKSAASAGAGPVVGVIQPPADPEPQKAPNRQPQFDGETADRSVNENSPAGTSLGDPVTASDADGDTLTYDLTGSDAFAINAAGQITVASSATLDYEDTPSYTLSVTVSDGKDASGEADDTVDDTITVNVSVTNVDEAGVASLAWDGDSHQEDTPLAATLLDPDGGVSGLAWVWQRSPDGSSDWNAIDGATSATYTPADEDTGYYLRAVASYADGHGPGKTAASAGVGPVVGVIPPDEKPEVLPQGTVPAQPTGFTATVGNEKVTLTWTDPGNSSITKYQLAYREQPDTSDTNIGSAAWTDISGSGATTVSHTVTGLKNNLRHLFWLRAVNSAGNGTHAGPAVGKPGPIKQTVPHTWDCIPEGVEPGDSFRLLFVSKTKRTAGSTSVLDYNNIVRSWAGNVDCFSGFSDQFLALLSTSAVDARDNTVTTGTGVPIYWVKGRKVADNYADFYDNSWDSRRAQHEDGTRMTPGAGKTLSDILIWTGSGSNGTKDSDSPVGAATVITGKMVRGDELHGPTLGVTTGATPSQYQFYGMSPVITVRPPPEEQTVPVGWSCIPDGVKPGDSFRLIFNSNTRRPATSPDIGTYDAYIQADAAKNACFTDFNDQFRAYISTKTVDARDHTDTAPEGVSYASGEGEPIYWLGGEKVADDYADFYDGTWNSQAGKTETGGDYTDRLWSGSNTDGTKSALPAGGSRVRSAHLGVEGFAISAGGGSTANGLRPLYALSPVFTVAPASTGNTAQTVPSDWECIPKDSSNNPLFTAGQSFRLLFVTSTKSDAQSSDIGTYNSFVQARANVHTACLQPFKDEFRALISTGTVDARDNTATAPAGISYTSGEGVPIYWVKGGKVADDYADFYDGTLESTGLARKNEIGGGSYGNFWTGSNGDGTKHATHYAGASSVRLGDWAQTSNILSHRSVGAVLSNVAVINPILAFSPVITVSPTDVWTATLTVDVDADTTAMTSYSGCDDDLSSHDNCSKALSDNDFVYAGVTYTVTALFVANLEDSGENFEQGDLAITLDTAMPAAERNKLTLHLGDTQFPLRDASWTTDNTFATWSGTGLENDWADGDKVAVKLTQLEPIEAQEVPHDWACIPSGLGSGDSFRLLFVTAGRAPNISVNDSRLDGIAFYNDHAKARAGDVTCLADFKDEFRVVASTKTVDARDNTGTAPEGSSYASGEGVPIYWLGRAKVADDYADFYDGSWDSIAGRYEDGGNVAITSAGLSVTTGSNSDGTKHTTLHLRKGLVAFRAGVLAADKNPLSHGVTTSTAHFYALSPVITVLAIPPTPATGSPAITGTPAVGETLTAGKGTIADINGLTKADNGDTGFVYTYQWIRVDSDGSSNAANISGATSSTYTLATADQGKKIKVKVAFKDDDGTAESRTSGAWPSGVNTIGAALAAPAGVTATAGVRSVTLSWADPNNAAITGYQYRLKFSGNATYGSPTAVPGSGASTTTYTVPNLTPLQEYTFQVRALKGSTDGLWSAEVSATPQVPALAGLTATPSERSVTLSWTNPAGCTAPLCSYDYRHRTAPAGGTPGAWSSRVTAASFTTATATGLNPGTRYEFEVRRSNPLVEAMSAIHVTTTGTALIAVPAQPANLRAAPGNRAVTLTWDKSNDATITTYQYRYKAAGGSYGSWVSVGSSATQVARVTALSNGTAYTFQLRAVNAGGAGPVAEAAATPNDLPSRPSGFSAVAGNTRVTLHWSYAGDATITKHQYRYKSAGGSYGAWTDIPNSARGTGHTVSGLNNGTAYTFQVRAVSANGNGPASLERTATPAESKGTRVTGVRIVSTPARDGTYSAGEYVGVEVTFSSSRIAASGTPLLELHVGRVQTGTDDKGTESTDDDEPIYEPITRWARYVGITGGNKAIFRYQVVPADEDADGVSVPAKALYGPRGDDDLYDPANFESAISELARTGSTSSTALGAQSGHKVDGMHGVPKSYVHHSDSTTDDCTDGTGSKTGNSDSEGFCEVEPDRPPAPVLTGIATVSSPASGDTYRRGETVVVAATFNSHAAEVEGRPTLTLRLSSSPNVDRQAVYAGSSGVAVDKKVLYFNYTVKNGDVSTGGIAIPGNPITLDEGNAIYDAFDRKPALISFTAVGAQSGHKVQTHPAIAGGLRTTAADDSVTLAWDNPASCGAGCGYQYRYRAPGGSYYWEHAADWTAWTDAPSPPTAATTEIWSATLTVDSQGGFFGCNNDLPWLENCSKSAVLTDDDFDYRGTTYAVGRLFWSSVTNTLSFNISGLTGAQAKTALSSLTLNVAGTAFAVSSASTAGGVVYWSHDPATDWTHGQTISLRLTAPATTVPTTATVTGLVSDTGYEFELQRVSGGSATAEAQASVRTTGPRPPRPEPTPEQTPTEGPDADAVRLDAILENVAKPQTFTLTVGASSILGYVDNPLVGVDGADPSSVGYSLIDGYEIVGHGSHPSKTASLSVLGLSIGSPSGGLSYDGTEVTNPDWFERHLFDFSDGETKNKARVRVRITWDGGSAVKTVVIWAYPPE